MNWLLGILAIGACVCAAVLWWQQAKADREFYEFLTRKEDR